MRTGGPILALSAVFALALWLRARWPQLPRNLKLRWLTLAALCVFSRSLSDAVHWELAASRINDLFIWARIAGYIVLVVLFSRLRPRLLTIPAALVLLLPLFSATIYLPLQYVFDPSPRQLTSVGDRVFLETTTWQRDGDDNRAVDYVVSRRARWLPFLQRTIRVGRLYRTQCDTDAISASLASPDLVLLHCPSGAPGQAPVDEDIALSGERKTAASAMVPSRP